MRGRTSPVSDGQQRLPAVRDRGGHRSSRWLFYDSQSCWRQARLRPKHQAETRRRDGLAPWPEWPASLTSCFCDERQKVFPVSRSTRLGSPFCSLRPVLRGESHEYTLMHEHNQAGTPRRSKSRQSILGERRTSRVAQLFRPMVASSPLIKQVTAENGRGSSELPRKFLDSRISRETERKAPATWYELRSADGERKPCKTSRAGKIYFPPGCGLFWSVRLGVRRTRDRHPIRRMCKPRGDPPRESYSRPARRRSGPSSRPTAGGVPA